MSTYTWAEIDPDLFYSVGAVAHGGGTEWLAAATAGNISRSTDSGQTWTKVIIGTNRGPSVQLCKNGTRWYFWSNGVSAASQLFYSDDGGATWTYWKDATVSWMVSDGTLLYMKLSSGTLEVYNNSLTLTNSYDGSGAWGAGAEYAASASAVMVSDDYNGYLYKSTDSGATWSQVVDATLGTDWTLGVSYLPISDRFVVANEGGVFVSDDDGATWSAFGVSGLPTYTGKVFARHFRDFANGVMCYVYEADTGGTVGLWMLPTGDTTWVQEYNGELTPAIGNSAGVLRLVSNSNVYVANLDPAAVVIVSADAFSQAVGTSSASGMAPIVAEAISAAVAASTAGHVVRHTALAISAAVGASTVSLLSIYSASAVSRAEAVGHTAADAVLQALALSYVRGTVEVPMPGDTAEVWVVNAETAASSRYEQYQFNSFAQIGGEYFGCRADGVYQLDGDDDAGEPVQAMVGFGKQSFGTAAKKRVPTAYVGVSSGGKLYLKVLVEGAEYLYVARGDSEQLREQRFDIGRGLSATYFEFELYNEGGADFELDTVEFVVIPLGRRI